MGDPPQEVVVEPAPPFAGESSYKREYTAKELPTQPEVVFNPKPAQPFHGDTAYRQHYTAKPSVRTPRRQKSAPSMSSRPWQEPLGAESTYKREYVELPLPN